MESKMDYNPAEDLLTDSDLHTQVVYAGFWLRFVAFLIDISLLVVILFMANLSDFFDDSHRYSNEIDMTGVVIMLAYVIYFPLMESSAWQATLGKKAVGIKVTTLYGERIGFGRAFGRFFSRILSQFFFCIGYIMAGFTEKRQALHDMIAGTLVVKN